MRFKDLVTMLMALMGFFIILMGFAWLVQGNDFFLAKVFAPAMEDVRRETFENSHAYNKAMVQELQNMQFQYLQANDDHKAGLASIILRRVADYDESKLPPDLSTFVSQVRRDHRLKK